MPMFVSKKCNSVRNNVKGHARRNADKRTRMYQTCWNDTVCMLVLLELKVWV